MPKSKPVRVAAVVLACLAGACASELPGEEPPEFGFYYPSSAVASADGTLLYVVSSNFDQRFVSGWVSTLDVAALIADVRGGGDGAAAQQGKPLLVPSLATTLSIASDGSRAILGARGGNPLTLLDVANDGALSCSEAGGNRELGAELQHTDCDQEHLTEIRVTDVAPFLDPEIELFDQHFADANAVSLVKPAGGQERVLVGYLSSGYLSVLAIRDPGDSARKKTGPLSHLAVASIGGSGLGRLRPLPGSNDTYVVGCSQYTGGTASTLYGIDLSQMKANQPTISRFGVSGVTGGREVADIAFSDDGMLAFAANRDPDSLLVVDSRPVAIQERDDVGQVTTVLHPSLRVTGAASVEGEPTAIAFLQRPDGALAVVASIYDDALFVLRMVGEQARMERRIDLRLGDGPSLVLPFEYDNGQYLLVGTFLAHGATLLDVSSADPQQFQILGRVGDNGF